MSRLHPARQALVVVAVLASVAALAPLLAPYDPNALLADGARVSMPPNAAHWLGTDTLSRDVLSRLLFGARISLGIAFWLSDWRSRSGPQWAPRPRWQVAGSTPF